MTPIKVILVDENEIFREGLAKLLRDQKEIEVTCLCSSGKQVIDRVKKDEPDVVMIDSGIPESDSVDITSEIGKISPEVKVAMLTDAENQDHFSASIRAGAMGYLSKKMKVNDLVKSIDLIQKGQVVVSPPLAAKLAKVTSRKIYDEAGKTPLSEREVEVMRLLVKGHTNKEIGQILFITENTARVHLKNILQKLRLRNRQQVAAYAMQQGIIREFENK